MNEKRKYTKTWTKIYQIRREKTRGRKGRRNEVM